MKQSHVRIFSGVLATVVLFTVLVACGGTSIADPKPTGPKDSFKSLARLTASDAAANDEFGGAVAISGDYAIVGAMRNNTDLNLGAAYVYKRTNNTWTEVSRLLASDERGGNFFGNSVDILGDYAIVGALYNDFVAGDAGAAYVYKRSGDTWNEITRLTASNAAFGDTFGHSVALSENYAIVGAATNDEKGSNAGSAYIFKRNGDSFVEVSKITASDAIKEDRFGRSVAISDNYAAVGALVGDAGPKSGVVYIYKRTGDTWNEILKLIPQDPRADNRFGNDIAISDDYIMTTAPSGGSDRSGVAYVYKRTGDMWNETARLEAENGRSIDFLTSVDFVEDYAIVGIIKTGKPGAALIFKRNGETWSKISEVAATGNATGDNRFGASVGISGDYVIAGAFRNDDVATDAGSAYVFQKFTE